MKATKAQRQVVRELNAIIHSRNLYRIADGARVINAHLNTDNAGVPAVVLELLHSGHVCLYADGKYKDGYGYPVNLNID